MWGFWDPHYTWYVLAPTLLIGGLAQLLVMSAFAKAKRLTTRRGLTGAEIAQTMLQREGLSAEIVQGGGFQDGDAWGVERAPEAARESGPIRIVGIGGMLTDHFDPARRTLCLSPEVFGAPSVASAAIAAHEAGHALQQRDGYLPLALRTGIVPLVNIGQIIAPIAVMVGLFAFGGPKGPLFQIGVLAYALMVLFSLVTLPVEFNASRRAYAALTSRGLVSAEEASVVRQVLVAAALTYVAAAVTQILHLLYILSLADRRRD